MVEVFKTNVQEQDQAGQLLVLLSQQFPLSKINFDLDDCDKILRIEAEVIAQEEIMNLIHMNGYQCCILE
jgi:hypothetical protein